MSRILFFILLLFPLSVVADDILIPIGSKHIVSDDHSFKDVYNEVNPGFIYQHDSGWMIGGFINSYDAPTYLIGKHYIPFANKKIGLDFGLSAYGNHKFKDKTQLTPIVQGTYDIGFVRVGYAPMISDKSYGVFTLQLIIPLN